MVIFKDFAEYISSRMGNMKDAELSRRLCKRSLNGGVTRGRIGEWKRGKQPKLENVFLVIEEFDDQPIAPYILELAGYHDAAEFERKRRQLNIGKEFLAKEDVVPYDNSPNLIPVPIVGRLDAGVVKSDFLEYLDSGFPPGAAEDYVQVREVIITTKTYAVRVIGDSMQPVIPPGSIAIINPEKPFVSGHVYVVRHKDGHVWLKKVIQRDDVFVLKSYNDDYEPIYLKKEDISYMHRMKSVDWPD